MFFKIDEPFEISVKYQLVNDSSRYVEYKVRNFMAGLSCDYLQEDTFDGSIEFVKIDRTNFIISGAFEFSTVNNECDTVRVTDGRFDLNYIP